ncbi:MAG: hypothetical protein ACRC2T_17095, partial [Thermoguttaceae bacterium]
ENKKDENMIRLLGLVNLSRAAVLNEAGDKDAALEGYERAVKVFKPLADKNDGETLYDIAGVKLNRGIIYRELGEYEKAKQELEESFVEFRALEKISELDTRFFMAKVSDELGGLMRENEEPADAIVEMYNRAMRLYVELIDAGDKQLEISLANSLLERCSAKFESDNRGDVEPILADVRSGIDILKKCLDNGLEDAYTDLCGAMNLYGIMLSELKRYDEAIKVFDEILETFSDLENSDDPTVIDEYACLFDNRGMCLLAVDKVEEALLDLSKGIELRETLWEEEWDLEDEILAAFAPALVSAYCNRAQVYMGQGKKDLAMDDCKKATNVLEPYADDLGEDYEEFREMIDEIR